MNIIELAKQAHGPITGEWWDMDVASLERFAELVAAHEREACAKVCDEGIGTRFQGDVYAYAIRARGTT